MALRVSYPRAAAKLLFAAACLASSARAQTAAPDGNPGVRIKQIKQEMVVDPQGRRTTTTHTQFQIQTPLAATQMAQIPVRFDGTMEEAAVLEAYTLKPDGRKIAVDPANILNQKAPQSNALMPLYTDGQQKLVIFPDVQAGDSLVFTTRLIDKQVVLPGHFTLSHYFAKSVPVDETTYSITVPRTMRMNTGSADMTKDVSRGGDAVTYRWGFSNPTPQKISTPLVTDPDAGPHFLLSSFKDYDEFGSAYAALIREKIAVTPEIQKQADLITSGISDRKEQARAIYNWITQRIRYVGIELGSGAIIPHDVNRTLINAFGDCKDQAVLFVSLLQAKGITADPVLINSGNRYRFSGVPTTSEFNHVIVWLPEWNLYADTTARSIPFEMLPLTDYGKPVIHLAANGASQHRTPIVAAGVLSSNYKVHAVMNAQGEFDVEASSTATAPWTTNLQAVAVALQAAGPTGTAASLLKGRGFADATGTLAFAPGPGGSMTVNGKFHTGQPPGGNLLRLPAAMQILARAGDGPLGPLGNPALTDSDETPCYSGQQTEELSFELANGISFGTPPADVHIQTDTLRYDAKWSVSGNTATLHREFVSQVTTPTCSGAVRRDVAEALAKIRSDYLRTMALNRP
jgi:hypothetical protein